MYRILEQNQPQRLPRTVRDSDVHHT
jgi:hypothetical protein